MIVNPFLQTIISSLGTYSLQEDKLNAKGCQEEIDRLVQQQFKPEDNQQAHRLFFHL